MPGPVRFTTQAASPVVARNGRVMPAEGPIYVHVTGRVAKPGLYRLPSGARVADAIAYAGGALENADLDSLNLATPLQDGQKLLVPAEGEPPPTPQESYILDSPMEEPRAVLVRPDPAPETPRAEASPAQEDVPALRAADLPRTTSGGATAKLRIPGEGVVNVNTASLAELQRLPGVGPSTARKILEYRQEHVRFQTIEELMEVRGIGPAKLQKMQPFVVLE